MKEPHGGREGKVTYCEVIVDIAHEDVDHVFTYAVPEGMTLCPGMRVLVPFGRRPQIEGIVIRLQDDCALPPEKVRQVRRALDPWPAVKPELLAIAEQIHRTAFCTLSQALRLMMPAEMRGGRVRERMCEIAVLAVSPAQALAAAEQDARAPKRQALLRRLCEAGEIDTALLREELGDVRPALRTLAQRGLLRLEMRPSRRRPYGGASSPDPKDPPLTVEQERVMEALLPALSQGMGRFLLFGVTGSGKTEIFIRAVRDVAQRGKTAIVLVPEIALTPQMVAWFRSRFGEDAAVLHSRLSAGERYDEWRRIHAGEVHVVIGARSAVFAPLSNVGLIIVDEEHELSYHAENQPQYDAREVAQWRCEREEATLLLASATPSLRSFARAGRGDLQLLEMRERVHRRPLPQVHIIDMREELRAGNRSVFSGALLDGLDRCLRAGKQAILFINRRGYSTFVSCRSCGYTVMCSQCDVSMTYHASDSVLRCHYCGREIPVPTTCPQCQSRYIRYFGTGTQRVEEEVRRFFPGVSVLRMDNDTTRQKDAHAELLDRFRRGEARILVGTQMIAKGLDFPDVTLVGIVAADAMLSLPDYRAQERAFQLLTQVAGRAGRAQTPGEVFLQSYDPEHETIRAASRQDYRAFYEMEMKRRKRAWYPPYTFVARLLIESEDESLAERGVRAAFAQMECFFEAQSYLRKYRVCLQAMPCPVRRLRGKVRWELVLKMIDKPICQEALERMSELVETQTEGARALLQINPHSMM